MTGTEKQISYAKSLISKVIKQAEKSLSYKNVDSALEDIADINEEFENGEIDANEKEAELSIANKIIADSEMLNLIISNLNSYDGDAGFVIEVLTTVNPVQVWTDVEFWSTSNGGKMFWELVK